MLQIKDLTIHLGGKILYSGVNLTLNPGIKYALVGGNGTGKTTLFRVITGELEPDDGQILIPSDVTIGYLPQDIIQMADHTVWDLAMEAAAIPLEIERKIEQLEKRLAHASDDKNTEKWLEQLDKLYHQRDVFRLNEFEGNAEKILIGLGFDCEEFRKPLKEFSGGWQMRAYLAKILLQNPDFLLLDEPTNHLDIQSLQWLEKFLTNFRGSVVFITHDKYFVDRLADKILYVHQQTIEEFRAPYDKFREDLQLKFEMLRQEYVNQQKKIQEIQRFIDRFRYKATKARQVQSRIKELEKMEKIEYQEEKKKVPDIRLHISTPSYNDVYDIEHLWFRYDQEWIIRDFDAHVFRGEKIGVIGPNGAGKTTLLKLLAQVLKPQKGNIRIGKRVQYGYYAQHQIEQLNIRNTILDEVMAAASPEMAPMVRHILGAFLFHDEEQEKRIEVLSGGEKARVALAKLLVRPLNTLILDEPTNHLDIESKEILAEALKQYEGTILVVSHDREFLDMLVNRIWFISREHQIADFTGNYSDFYSRNAHLFESDGDKKAAPEHVGGKEQKETRNRYQLRKELKRQIQKLEREISDMELKMENIQEQLRMLENELSSGNLTPHELTSKSQEYQELKLRLENLENSWLEKQEQQEKLSLEYQKMN